MNLDEIVERLYKYGQRASYGAVGEMVGRPARSVMSGRPKTPRNSWVVSKTTGEPSGYLPSERDPRLGLSRSTLTTLDGLVRWLREHP